MNIRNEITIDNEEQSVETYRIDNVVAHFVHSSFSK